MSRFWKRSKYWLGGLALGVVGWACGPFFGVSVVYRRQEALLAPPSFGFYRQLSSLAPKTPGFADIPNAPWWADRPKLPGEAYGAGLALYNAGKYDDARPFFERALRGGETPEVNSRYMLGMTAMRLDERPLAQKIFAEVRAAAKQGKADPEGVAAETLGEDALIAWDAGDQDRAVELYAQQAAHGSGSGRASLIMIARRIMKDPARLARGVRDERTRRLLMVCLIARDDEHWKLERMVEALKSQKIAEAPGAGWLAAAAYKRGNFALAERLAALEPSGAAAWVRAKLALRRGDRAAALAEYQKALIRARNAGMEEDTLAGERALLALAGQDYAQALDLFLAAASVTPDGPWSDYWTDAAHVAERVMTAEQLRAYVDRRVPAKSPWEKRLRGLLARRLMRDGQLDAALPYFDDGPVRAKARAYRDAIGRAQSAWRPVAWRASAWWEAARAARYDGLEILGYELAPDFAVFDGNFTLGEEAKPGEPFVSADEARRLRGSLNTHRFHYRLTGVKHAEQAVALVPARSQAFAAVLCEAAHWVRWTEPPVAKALYARWVKEGAAVPWGREFAQACPLPKFETDVAWRARLAVERKSRRVGFDLWPALMLACGGLLVAAVAWVGYRR